MGTGEFFGNDYRKIIGSIQLSRGGHIPADFRYAENLSKHPGQGKAASITKMLGYDALTSN